MREWCLVLDCPSSKAAKSVGRQMQDLWSDVDVEANYGRVWCFAEYPGALRTLSNRIPEEARANLLMPPSMRVWSEQHHCWVDPAMPDEDPDSRELWIDDALEPHEIQWRVRLELESVFSFRAVRRELPKLARPVIATGNRSIELGARDAADATDIAERAAGFHGVASAAPSPIRGRLRRWWIRQQLAGNYSVGADGSGPAGYDFSSFGWGGGGHGGGGDGGGGHGGGGHG